MCVELKYRVMRAQWRKPQAAGMQVVLRGVYAPAKAGFVKVGRHLSGRTKVVVLG
jgi:hypothetical protein